MQNFIIILTLSIMTNLLIAQTPSSPTTKAKSGLSFGLALGAGTLSLKSSKSTETNIGFSVSLPNIKIGYSFSDRFTGYLALPGATYKFEDKDRGYEAIMLSGQYWLIPKWWISMGSGITFDAPAFYAVENFEEAKFYTGTPAFSFGTGYEILKNDNFTIDLQYRIFMGQSNVSDTTKREGVANMIMIGFNWY